MSIQVARRGGLASTRRRSAGAAASFSYVNRTVIQSARNGTTTHTVSFPAATAGNLLVLMLAGGVTLTTPTGWTLVSSSVSAAGMYVWKRTAVGGEVSITTTANGANFPIGGVVYELVAPSSIDLAFTRNAMEADSVASPNVVPTVSQVGYAFVNYAKWTTGETSTSVTWSAGTSDFAAADQFNATDGYLTAGAWISGSGAVFAPVTTPNVGDTGPNARQSISLVLSVSVAPPAPLGPFVLQGSQIIDPFGHPFIPVGLNVNGPDWVWGGPTVGQSAAMATWGFNTVRLDTCFVGGCTGQPDSAANNDLDGIVAEYTSQHYVVMLAQMQYGSTDTISDTDLASLASWWQTNAIKYKDNPYVWFNLANEPTGTNLADWYRISTALAAAVRSVAPNNIIVVDGNSSGQDKGGWDCAGDDWPLQSGPYNHGLQMRADYGNVIFSTHFYGEWGGNETLGCDLTGWTANLNAYLDAMQTLGLVIVAGEYGSVVNLVDEPWYQGGAWNATHAVHVALPAHNVGMLFWHGDVGAGNMHLLIPLENWTDWTGNPAELTWLGTALYNYAKSINP